MFPGKKKKNCSVQVLYLLGKILQKINYITYVCVSFLKWNTKKDNIEYFDSQYMSLNFCIQT